MLLLVQMIVEKGNGQRRTPAVDKGVAAASWVAETGTVAGALREGEGAEKEGDGWDGIEVHGEWLLGEFRTGRGVQKVEAVMLR